MQKIIVDTIEVDCNKYAIIFYISENYPGYHIESLETY